VELADVEPMVRDAVTAAVAALPTPQDGRSVELADVEPMIRDAVTAAVAALPTPQDGRSVELADVEPMVRDAVTAAVAALPTPQDGRSVELADVEPMVRDAVTAAVAALPSPKDGVGLAGALIDRGGNLVLTLTDGSQRELGTVVGKDADQAAIDRQVRELVAEIPRPRDGFSLKDFDTHFDGERTLTLKFDGGDVSYEHEIHLPIVIYRDVWRAENDDGSQKFYERGDCVTWAGSLWIAQERTSEKPDGGKGWRLAVKKGRDGKSAT
jgi:hypothetical protein